MFTTNNHTITTPSHLPKRRLATVKQAATVLPFTELAIRDLIFKAEDRATSRGEPIPGNGLGKSGAIIRVGRKVLIDLDRFEAWIDRRGSNAGGAA